MTEKHENARILIAEDDESNVLLLRMLLENAGYANLHSITDPRRLLEVVEQAEPDILLLDLHMPHLSGLEVMEGLRGRDAGDHSFPIVILSGDTSPHTRDQALSLGASDFLVKPFDLNAVLECVDAQLRAHLGDRA
ncbi:MAG: response regulator [Actinomycetota bacterium]